ncbi:hypothetical protein HMPREF1092_01475 [Clostridium thermobutyricum]|uniref:Uncharacterized protein n=1 Tax=Clostridium thermobutyricum TaxID=29372 RepID=N9WHC0_9CLOT|nr:hypothetical protein [Clostridium thermobutyricum]ENZ02240.1 hypothetical protein HMPREF1092_01475 [Clostridium thermobutyricum]
MNLNYTLTKEEFRDICKFQELDIIKPIKLITCIQSTFLLLLLIISTKLIDINLNYSFLLTLIIFTIISIYINLEKIRKIISNKSNYKSKKYTNFSNADIFDKKLIINSDSVILSSKISTTQIFLNSIKKVKIKDDYIVLNKIYIPTRLFDTEESLRHFIDFLNDSIDNSKANLSFDLNNPEYVATLQMYLPHKIYFHLHITRIIISIAIYFFIVICLILDLLKNYYIDSTLIFCVILYFVVFLIFTIYFLLLIKKLRSEKYFFNCPKLKKTPYIQTKYRTYIKGDYIYFVESKKGQDISIQKIHIYTYSQIEEKGNLLSLNDSALFIHKNSFESVEDKNKFIEFFNK